MSKALMHQASGQGAQLLSKAASLTGQARGPKDLASPFVDLPSRRGQALTCQLVQEGAQHRGTKMRSNWSRPRFGDGTWTPPLIPSSSRAGPQNKEHPMRHALCGPLGVIPRVGPGQRPQDMHQARRQAPTEWEVGARALTRKARICHRSEPASAPGAGHAAIPNARGASPQGQPV